MRDSDTFTAHAARCHAEADAATLDNVKERSLRAEKAWLDMAARSRKTEAARDAREARPLAQVAPSIFPPEG